MTVTVVRGFIGSSAPSADSKQVAKTPAATGAVSASSPAMSAITSITTTLNEATISNIRLAKTITAGEKVRNESEARGLSESLAERIKELGESGDAHSDLSLVSARQHFS